MILVENLFQKLRKNKITFFSGVPDSILKNLSFYLDKKIPKKHIVAPNEGAAVSLGIGYNLSSDEIPCIYMQNSGLSNAMNPLISIANKNVYSIPLFLIIGWRGAPNVKDEPQHEVKGKITPKLLELLKIKYYIIRNDKDLKKIDTLISNSKKNQNVVACLIEKGTLKSKIKFKNKISFNTILRKDFINTFLNEIPKNSNIISTTGYTSRELYQLRKLNNSKKGKDFYMVGGMGHSSMVSLGVSIRSKNKTFCLDGDGSVLMHLGSLSTIGYLKNKNFKHILLNNNSHESVGGQSTNSEDINFKKLVTSLGYSNYYLIKNENKIQTTLKKFIKSKGPSFLEVKIKKGTINNLTRPKNLKKLKEKFKYIK